MRNQIRLNITTNNWVIYAPERGKRPKEHKIENISREELPEYDDSCPFCLGNEDMLEEISSELPAHNKEWKTRIVPNKYPVIDKSGDSHRSRDGIYLQAEGYGIHEVIIETPRHDIDIPQMDDNDVLSIIETYHMRYVHHMQNQRNLMCILFRNHGAKAGTSLIHPHSQMIVTGVVPQDIRMRETEAQRFYDRYLKCIYCRILEKELEERKRIVYENDTIAAFVPYYAEVPFEIWIMPKAHQADFGDISLREKHDLASALKQVLSKLYDKIDDLHYNYVINTAPRYKQGEPQLHWFISIRPRLTTPAGFEIGSGISINPHLPEDDAKILNE